MWVLEIIEKQLRDPNRLQDYPKTLAFVSRGDSVLCRLAGKISGFNLVKIAHFG